MLECRPTFHNTEIVRTQPDEKIFCFGLSVFPDLVGLQEVDRGVKRTQGLDEIAELAQMTNMVSVNYETVSGHLACKKIEGIWF
ncbi:MAG TPA: hypothetical protein VGN86_02660 [Pyrinomonadaceae bacterium]|nr:hypothetical protein [Pyrinomonadaceae bacterium]